MPAPGDVVGGGGSCWAVTVCAKVSDKTAQAAMALERANFRKRISSQWPNMARPVSSQIPAMFESAGNCREAMAKMWTAVPGSEQV
jgi:hypothetical protein